MVEPLLSGIVLGMITVTGLGLFVAAFLQYRRGSQFEVQNLNFKWVLKFADYWSLEKL